MNALSVYRLSHWFYERNLRVASRIIDKINYLIFGCYLPGSARIGHGCQIAYGGMSVVIHGDSIIGNYCMIGQTITLGAKEAYVSDQQKASPIVGNDVYISAGARLLGGITIGDCSIIGANAVVTSSFPPHSIIVGIPAKSVKKTDPDYRAIQRP